MPILQTNSRIIKSPNREISDYVSRINAAGGSISDTSIQAHRTFIQTLKQNNLWDKCLEIGTYAGNNLNAALVKLKYPLGVQSSLTNVGFLGGDYSESTGLSGDTSGNKYLKTGFIPSTQLTTSLDVHLSVYNRNIVALGGSSGSPPYTYLGSSGGAGNFWVQRSSSTNTNAILGAGGEMLASATNVIVSGLLIGSTVASNTGYLFHNGNQIGTDTSFTTNSLSSSEIYTHGLNQGGVLSRQSNLICAFHSMGYGLNPTEASAFYNAVQTLQAALGRQV